MKNDDSSLTLDKPLLLEQSSEDLEKESLLSLTGEKPDAGITVRFSDSTSNLKVEYQNGGSYAARHTPLGFDMSNRVRTVITYIQIDLRPCNKWFK